MRPRQWGCWSYRAILSPWQPEQGFLEQADRVCEHPMYRWVNRGPSGQEDQTWSTPAAPPRGSTDKSGQEVGSGCSVKDQRGVYFLQMSPSLKHSEGDPEGTANTRKAWVPGADSPAPSHAGNRRRGQVPGGTGSWAPGWAPGGKAEQAQCPVPRDTQVCWASHDCRPSRVSPQGLMEPGRTGAWN